MANPHRGEYLHMLVPASAPEHAEAVAFTLRLTFNDVCAATASLSKMMGREYTARDITVALAGGYYNYNVLRALFFESIRGQHDVFSLASAGDLLERNKTKLLLIAVDLGKAFNAIHPADGELEGLDEILRQLVGDDEDDPAGKDDAPPGGAST